MSGSPDWYRYLNQAHQVAIPKGSFGLVAISNSFSCEDLKNILASLILYKSNYTLSYIEFLMISKIVFSIDYLNKKYRKLLVMTKIDVPSS